MRKIGPTLGFVLVAACASSGSLFGKPTAIAPEGVIVSPAGRVQGGRERFVRVESPDGGLAECSDGDGVIWLYHRGVTVEVELLDKNGSWLKLECSGYSLAGPRRFLMFSLAPHPDSYRSVRVKASESIIIPSITWGRRHDI
jgi:hypothetical protein